MEENPLKQPERNKNIPQEAKWLGGVGEGAWFRIQECEEERTEGKEPEGQNFYRIQRWGKDGTMHCDRIFKEEASTEADTEESGEYTPFSIDKEYKFTYVSHCLRCTIKQNGRLYGFVYIGEHNE